MPIGGSGSGGMEQLQTACEKQGRNAKDMDIALFGAPADLDFVKGRIDQGFTDMIFGLPQTSSDGVLKQLDKIAEVDNAARQG
jgi:hypothetical protein